MTNKISDQNDLTSWDAKLEPEFVASFILVTEVSWNGEPENGYRIGVDRAGGVNFARAGRCSWASGDPRDEWIILGGRGSITVSSEDLTAALRKLAAAGFELPVAPEGAPSGKGA